MERNEGESDAFSDLGPTAAFFARTQNFERIQAIDSEAELFSTNAGSRGLRACFSSACMSCSRDRMSATTSRARSCQLRSRDEVGKTLRHDKRSIEMRPGAVSRRSSQWHVRFARTFQTSWCQ
eukprot:6174416-Pleurochrysis_carterae.AAC.2